jgi:hypothetical protein
MSARRTPADGTPADGPADGQTTPGLAFGVRLQLVSGELQALYDRLGALADELEADVVATEDDPDWLDALGRALALGEIRSSVLTARHAIHGAIIGVIRARPQASSRRHP